MPAHIIAAHMARDAVRRNITDPQPPARPRRARRATARILQAAAHRLDPRVAPAPQLRLYR